MIDTNNIQIATDGEEMEDILECLTNLFSITKGTQPLCRCLGLTGDYISLPLPVAENKFSLDVYEVVEEYEPRAEIIDIQFISNQDGAMIPTIKVRRAEGG